MNNNKSNKIGIVIIIISLIFTIIGATFAYFSASITAPGTNLAGNTLDVTSGSLSVTVTPKLEFSGKTLTGDKHDKLVPANMTETQVGLASAVSANCEDTESGYTGCHVYEIAVTLTNAMNDVTLSANLSLTGTDDDNWSYALLQTSTPTTGPYSTGTLNLSTLKSNSASPSVSIHRF